MSTNVDELTVPEKILLAADHLDRQGQSPFSAESLIVTVWQKFPRTFGLKGYAEQHPDSNKVLSSIMGEKGLARRGWLVKMGQKLYALTREGRQVVRRVMLEEETTPNAIKLTRDQEQFLISLQESSAAEKFEENRKSELTFADACRFWGIAESMHGDALDARLAKFEEQINYLDRVLDESTTVLSTGREVAGGDVRVLMNIHRHMEDRFDRHLNVLRSRSTRR